MTTTVLPPGATWSMRDVRRVFAQLSAPEVPELAGRRDGAFAGRPGLRRLTAAIATASPLRGWCGKEIDRSGDVRNLVRRGGAIEKSVAAVGGARRFAARRPASGDRGLFQDGQASGELGTW